jgi:zinc transport system substrate-binding protein
MFGQMAACGIRRWFGLMCWCFLVFGFVSGAGASPASAQVQAQGQSRPVGVVVSHSGLLWLAQQLFAPEATGVVISTFVPPGTAPETFEPRPSMVTALASAQIFVASGVPFEQAWVPRIRSVAPQMVVVDAFGTLGKERQASAHKHHGHGHDHDPHLWSSPRELAQAAERMVQVVAKNDALRSHPAFEAEIMAKRLRATRERLTQLETEISSMLAQASVTKSQTTATAARQRFFVFHPAWGAFAENFGLEQVALEDDGHSPGPAYLEKFLKLMKSERARAIYVQPQMSRREADAVARRTSVRVVVVDPMAADLPSELLRFSKLLRDELAERAPLADRER